MRGRASGGTGMRVYLEDGIVIDTLTLGTIVCDARRPRGDIAILSHAHSDHLPRTIGETPMICSPLTASLASERQDIPVPEPRTIDAIELLPSGHIDGSRAALIRDGSHRILFSGDIATEGRFGLKGFEPVAADTLIIEATYGDPQYSFPSPHEIKTELIEWIRENEHRPIVLFAYELGKAQRVLKLLEEMRSITPYVTNGIHQITQMIEEHTGTSYPAKRIDPESHLEAGEIAVMPSQMRRSEWYKNTIEFANPLTAGISGWAIDHGFIYRRKVDRGFPLSDHCDFSELIELVHEIDPDTIFTHHGKAMSLARELTKEGFDATALHRNQSSLTSFG